MHNHIYHLTGDESNAKGGTDTSIPSGKIDSKELPYILDRTNKETFFMHEIFEHDISSCPLVTDFERLTKHYTELLKESAYAEMNPSKQGMEITSEYYHKQLAKTLSKLST